VRQLEKAFAGWAAKPLPKLALPEIQTAKAKAISGLDRPGATQSQVWVVGPLFAASDADAVAMRVANYAIGGLFTSRLNLNLREKHGYSYGVFSGLQLARNFGWFEARGGIVAKSTAPALDEYEKELAQFATGDLTDAEFARSRDMYVRGLPALLETNDAVSSAVANLVSLGLPVDYYRKVPEVAQALTREQVAAAVKKWIHPESWPIVVVGAVNANKEALEKLNQGPLTVKAVK
jgi:zinc protease